MPTLLAPASTTAPRSLVRATELGESARTPLAAARNLHALVDGLVRAGLASDAVAAIAHALPKPLVIAWVSACLARSGAADPRSARGRELAEGWLREPTEERRQQAADAIAGSALADPGQWLAAAVAWSGGSLAPPGYAKVAPAAHLTARAAVAALRLAAASSARGFPAELAADVQEALRLYATDEPASGS